MEGIMEKGELERMWVVWLERISVKCEVKCGNVSLFGLCWVLDVWSEWCIINELRINFELGSQITKERFQAVRHRRIRDNLKARARPTPPPTHRRLQRRVTLRRRRQWNLKIIRFQRRRQDLPNRIWRSDSRSG